MKVAVLDIGTNSFILLLAEIQNREFQVLDQYFEIPQPVGGRTRCRFDPGGGIGFKGRV